MKPKTIDDLKAAPYNPRTISEVSKRGLAASMSGFGDLSGIVWNSKTGNLVAGHQRLGILRAKGAKLGGRGAQVWIDDPETGERFRVRIVEWDEATERTANLAANNPEIGGEFTADLSEALESVQERPDFDALLLGHLVSLVGDEMPDLGALPLGDQPRLDRKTPVTCPECSHEFTP